ncbi:glycerophosphodiester phosphodiesterase [Ornithinibacillus gellani]|uniref:glycerophosphodiester phosphodiesterase n=1 Tax=Ornithinibacillus gellani TaxID=2293253 RepID=UPI000F49F6F0|nr:glycerophosphodiester phosphodiesterase family protein [Ornithinibacillus gellani]TQS71258.1 glycerophosphodiester phosphodiesterase [Ornithinibacillus gellani]
MVLNFAHRGSLTDAPENTLPAFLHALDHGAKAIELDVQLTKDGALVVCHDHTLKRFNPAATKRIKDCTLAEIKQIDIGSTFSEAYQGLTLATLEEVLDLVPPDVLLNIEIKNIPVLYEGIEQRLLDCLKQYNRMETVIISSFDHVALEKVQQLAPDMDLGMLFHYRILRTWDYVRESGLRIRSIHPNQVYVDQNFVQQCKALGYEVYPYTVLSKSRYEELLSYGVDGTFTNLPSIFGQPNA